MSLSIDYNGWGSTTNDWDSLDISEHRTELVYGDDGFTPEAVRHRMSGTALVNSTGPSDLRDKLVEARQRLARSGKALSITFGGSAIADIDPDNQAKRSDEQGYPQAEFSVASHQGLRTAVIGWTFEWSDVEPITGAGEDSTFHVVSHVWGTEWDLDRNGLARWNVAGTLKVRDNVVATGIGQGAAPRLGSNPDAYRGLVAPAPPPGFRLESQQWIVNESGNRLTYRLLYQEHARDLPQPAFAGEASTRFYSDIEHAYTGTKTFQGELSGGRNTNPHHLLSSLVLMAKRVIKFDGSDRDLVLSIEVTEPDVLSRNAVGLRIQARGLQASTSSQVFSGITVGIDFTEGNKQLQSPSVYGAQFVRSAKRALFEAMSGYTSSTFPTADWQFAGSQDVEYQVADADYPGEYTGGGIPPGTIPDATPAHLEYNYHDVETVHRVSEDNRLMRVGAYGAGAADRVYQAESPAVLIETLYSASRLNQAPVIAPMAPPGGAMIKKQRQWIEKERPDANGNVLMRAYYYRVIEALDTGDGGLFATDTVSIDGVQTITRRFTFPAGVITQPFDPRQDDASEAAGRGILQPGPVVGLDLQAVSAPLISPVGG